MIAIQLRESDLDIIRRVCAAHPGIERAIVFGSRARGDALPGADLDLAVVAPAMTDREWTDFREAMEESALIYPFDLVRVDRLAPGGFRERIEREGIDIDLTRG